MLKMDPGQNGNVFENAQFCSVRITVVYTSRVVWLFLIHILLCDTSNFVSWANPKLEGGMQIKDECYITFAHC